MQLFFCLLALRLRLSHFGLPSPAIGKVDSESDHVVVTKLAVGVLVHVLDIEVGAKLLLRQLDFRGGTTQHGLAALQIWILLARRFKQGGCRSRKRSLNERLGDNIR